MHWNILWKNTLIQGTIRELLEHQPLPLTLMSVPGRKGLPFSNCVTKEPGWSPQEDVVAFWQTVLGHGAIINENLLFLSCCSLLEPDWSEKLFVLAEKTLLKLYRDPEESTQHEKLSSCFFIMFGHTANKDFSTENPLQHHIYQYQHSDTNSVNNKGVIIILHLHIKSLWAFIW